MAAGREKKLICDTEGEIVVAHGHLPSPALSAVKHQTLSLLDEGGKATRYLQPVDDVTKCDLQHGLPLCRPTLTRFALKQNVLIFTGNYYDSEFFLFLLGSIMQARLILTKIL